MTHRIPRARRLLKCVIATALVVAVTAPVAGAGGAGEAEGISLFPDRGLPGPTPPPDPPASRYVVGAVVGTIVVFPFLTARCVAGDIAGFLTGSAMRVPVWMVSGGGEQAGQPLERAGNTMVAGACDRPLYVRPSDLEAWRPPAD